jgi:hypothetical protein
MAATKKLSAAAYGWCKNRGITMACGVRLDSADLGVGMKGWVMNKKPHTGAPEHTPKGRGKTKIKK